MILSTIWLILLLLNSILIEIYLNFLQLDVGCWWQPLWLLYGLYVYRTYINYGAFEFKILKIYPRKNDKIEWEELEQHWNTEYWNTNI